MWGLICLNVRQSKLKIVATCYFFFGQNFFSKATNVGHFILFYKYESQWYYWCIYLPILNISIRQALNKLAAHMLHMPHNAKPPGFPKYINNKNDKQCWYPWNVWMATWHAGLTAHPTNNKLPQLEAWFVQMSDKWS